MSSLMAQELSESRLFDDAESELISRAFDILEAIAPRDSDMLRSHLDRLPELSAMIHKLPSLYASETFAGKKRSLESLVDTLCENDGLTGELALPLKATLARTFLVAKIQFLRGFVRVTDSQVDAGGPDAEEFTHIADELREELAQSIYTQLAEELLLALLRKPNVRITTKRRSARQLVAIWENAELEIDDFCPLLESAWHARNRVNADLGSLLGTSEYFNLVCEDCAPQFLDFFNRDEVPLQQAQAFEEFLFDMTWEELSTLRSEMRLHNLASITQTWAAEVLGREIEVERKEGRIDPLALYRSYFRRQLAADFRIVAGRPGPQRTAEAYMMIFLLDSQNALDALP